MKQFALQQHLRCLDALIAYLGGSNDAGRRSRGPCDLLLEHLRAARRELRGSMHAEYRLSLQQARKSVACISDRTDRTKIKKILRLWPSCCDSLTTREEVARVPTPREYYESRRDHAYDLFLHYSNVRMNILAFVIPFGGVIAADHSDKWNAGMFLIGAAMVLNWIFGWFSLIHLINSRHVGGWLKTRGDAEIAEICSDVNFSAWLYPRLLFCPKGKLTEHEKLVSDRKVERIIQGVLLIGCAILISLLR
jgi:hypothetical protein